MAPSPLRTIALTVALLCGFVVASAAAAPVPLRADLDADGIADTVIVLSGPSSLPRVELQLSGRRTPVFLLAPVGVQGFQVIDLTGDGRKDLLADSAVGRLVWVNTGSAFMPHPVRGLLGCGTYAPRLAGAGARPTAPTGDNDSTAAPAFEAPPVLVLDPLSASGLALVRTCGLRTRGSILESRGPPTA